LAWCPRNQYFSTGTGWIKTFSSFLCAGSARPRVLGTNTFQQVHIGLTFCSFLCAGSARPRVSGTNFFNTFSTGTDWVKTISSFRSEAQLCLVSQEATLFNRYRLGEHFVDFYVRAQLGLLSLETPLFNMYRLG